MSLPERWRGQFAAIFAACPASTGWLWTSPSDKTISQPASPSSRVLMDCLGLILAQTGCFGLYSKHGEQIAGVIMLLVGKMVKTGKKDW
jgi:hypothetical protein